MKRMKRIYVYGKFLESYVVAGKIKSIGVSNFNIEQLQYLIDHASMKPVLNQFQSYRGDINKIS